MRHFIFLLLSQSCTFLLSGQVHLDKYISEALLANDSLREQQFLLENRQAVLSEARSQLYPGLDFRAEYLDAYGGRTFRIPTGQLMNPVYQALNQLTGSNDFPKISDAFIPANPEGQNNFKLRATVPLVNRELVANRSLREEQVSLQEVEVSLAKRELVYQVKKSYYQYWEAVQAKLIYQQALSLARENARINQTLLNEGKANRTTVLRDETEIVKWQAEIIAATEKENNALAYFNFLCNRGLTAPIEKDSLDVPLYSPIYRGDDSIVLKREEIKAAGSGVRIARQSLHLERSRFMPKLGGFVETGFQGKYWNFNQRPFYCLFGIALDWPLYTGGRKKAKERESIAEMNAATSGMSFLRSKLSLQIFTTQNELSGSIAHYQACSSQRKTAEAYASDLLKMYKLGMALHIELLEAQNQYILARLKENIALIDLQIQLATVERVSAAYPIN